MTIKLTWTAARQLRLFRLEFPLASTPKFEMIDKITSRARTSVRDRAAAIAKLTLKLLSRSKGQVAGVAGAAEVVRLFLEHAGTMVPDPPPDELANRPDPRLSPFLLNDRQHAISPFAVLTLSVNCRPCFARAIAGDGASRTMRTPNICGSFALPFCESHSVFLTFLSWCK